MSRNMSRNGWVSFESGRLRATSALWALLGLGLATAFCPRPGMAQVELARKVQTKVMPTYPALARQMNIRGTVRMIVVVSPSGSLKDTKVVGGNPILVNAAVDALKKWKFEPARDETTGTIEFKFQSPN